MFAGSTLPPWQRGWYAAARRLPSPHQDARPPGTEIDLLVVHGISLPPGRYGGGYIDRLFTGTLDPGAHPQLAELAGVRVSAHFLIDRNGAVTQYVPLHRRAWHAGESSFRGRGRCNDYSLGVELEGTDHDPYADLQYQALARLTAALLGLYPLLGPERIVGHSDIAPGRKTDPGPYFDWPRYRRLIEPHARGAGSVSAGGEV